MYRYLVVVAVAVSVALSASAAEQRSTVHEQDGPTLSRPAVRFPEVARNQKRDNIDIIALWQDLDPEGWIGGGGGATGCVKNSICNDFSKKCEEETSTGGGCNSNGCINCVPK